MSRILGLLLLLVSAGSLNAKLNSNLVTIPKGQWRPFLAPTKTKTSVNETVKIQSFQIMAAPVTNGEFQEFLREYPEWSKSKVKSIFVDAGYLDQFQDDRELKKSVLANAPVTSVSWFAARAFCEANEMRLPTEAEWEYVGDASQSKANASRDPEFLREILNWYSEPSGETNLPAVRTRKPNLYGAYDLHSLIWEWVEDFNSSLQTDEGRGAGELNKNLFCGAGGSSGANKEDYAAYMRFAFRSSLKGSSVIKNLGFRCAKDISK